LNISSFGRPPTLGEFDPAGIGGSAKETRPFQRFGFFGALRKSARGFQSLVSFGAQAMVHLGRLLWHACRYAKNNTHP
jgi:hypothetical protein